MPILFEKKGECCGCTACYAVCPTKSIKMRYDREGFLYPSIDVTRCVECNACIRVCPLKNVEAMQERPKSQFWVAKHRSDDVRYASSSGGAFTAISDSILELGGVIYGVVFDENITAVHARGETIEQRNAMRVSKYVQSNVNDTFVEAKIDLDEGKMVLFTGTPCQIAGLRNYLKKDYEKLLTVDIVCHGTPSPLMFEEHIRHIEKVRKSPVVHYVCRSKKSGWHKHMELAVLSNGKEEYGTPLAQEHKTLFYSGHILRPSCYDCHFTNLERPSDITMADFWGVENCMPEYDDQVGISLLLINTEKGEKMLRAIDSEVEYRPSESYGKQPHLERSADMPADRKIFWEEYEKRGYAYVAAKYGRNGFINNVKYHIKKLLRM